MKKWGLLLFFLSSLMVTTDGFSQSSGSGQTGSLSGSQLPCCWKSQIHTSPECCVQGAWGNEENYEYRMDDGDGGCCAKNNVTEAFTKHENGEYVRGSVITKTCCESQDEKGKDPGNYKFWPTQGSTSTEDEPGKGGVCCIADSWKWWSTGSNNGRCCRAQGGKEKDDRCCIGAYDVDSKTSSKECCKVAEGEWKNGDCCAKEKDGMAVPSHMERSVVNGKVEVSMSGAKVTSNCCTADGGQAYNKSFDGGNAELGCCIGGSTYGVSYDDANANNVIEGCCLSPKTVSDLGDIDACCNSDEEGYIKTQENSSGGEDKVGACCKGQVYIKAFVEPKDGNYGNQECCETDKFVIGGACCQNSDDKDYPDGDYYSCCPSSNLADASDVDDRECCEDSTSPRNVNGKATEACCKHAYGTWVGGEGSQGTGYCCKGSFDLVTGSRTEICCEDAGGMWMGGFCCYTWGKKVGEACVADELPEEDGEKGYAGPLGGR